MTLPYATFEDGKLFHLSGGQYVEDPFAFNTTLFLNLLKSLPEEYRTEQDRRFIQEIQDALKARRAYEEEKA